MTKIAAAALAALTLAGGALTVAEPAAAQPYGYGHHFHRGYGYGPRFYHRGFYRHGYYRGRGFCRYHRC